MDERRSTQSFDTSPEAAEVRYEVLRRMTPGERLDQAAQLSAACRGLLADGVRLRHPEYDERRVRLAVIRLTLPKELFDAAYPESREILP